MILLLLALGIAPVAAQSPPSRTEQRIRAAVTADRDDRIAYLQRVVDIPSSTLDLEGVRRVGAVFRDSLDSLGFTTRWATMPEEMGRAGHLVAERRGKPGMARLLLIGHLDTVVRPDGSTFARRDSVAKGVGATDMKGADVVILYALRALRGAGDISFVAPFMDSLDGLGALGSGSHTPEESVDRATLEMQTRAALLIHRLGNRRP